MKKILTFSTIFCFSFMMLTGCFDLFDDDDDNKLSAPKNLQASDGTYVDKIELTWDCVSRAVSYNVYVSETSNGTYTKINSSAITTCGSDVTGATPGVVFYYKVTAVDSKGEESDFSDYDSGYVFSSDSSDEKSYLKIVNAMSTENINIIEIYLSSEDIDPNDSNTWGTELLDHFGYDGYGPGYWFQLNFPPGTYDILVRSEEYNGSTWYISRDNESFDADEFNTIYWHQYNSYDYYDYDYSGKGIDTMKQIVK
ncbi:MAG: fibronectin type III domain-containing protein [Spirochaetota bacterium]|nr:fibronectin type III domain-containing protein [Spirochaetota bacterium]